MKILELTVSERIILAEKLWDSVIEEDESSIELSLKLQEELDHRLQAYINDQEFGSSWSEVKERIISKE